MFVSVLNATSYALEKLMYLRQMGYSVGLIYTGTFMGIELNTLTVDASTVCCTPCKASNVSLVYKNINSL